MACYAGFLAGREAARLMLPRGRGCIFFTGATASLRGGVGYAAFASAKFGLRAVAQSAARELGPRNITFFVGDEIFFGKDRLRDVEERILELRAEGQGSR
jgi:NAD(P)-dependent dehydrogenase (short-subunit alcohol dehydrogenase family)